MRKAVCYIDYELTKSQHYTDFIQEIHKNKFHIFSITEDVDMSESSKNSLGIKVFNDDRTLNSIEKICLRYKTSIHDCLFIFRFEDKKIFENLPKYHLFEINHYDKDCMIKSLKDLTKYFKVLRYLRLILIFSILILNTLLVFDLPALMYVILLLFNGYLIYLLFFPLSIISIFILLNLLVELIVQF